jgi:hypothetical protein
MSGIKTLEDIRQRCRIDQDSKCWDWGGGITVIRGSEVAYLHYSPDGTKETRKQMPAGRAAWIASGRKAEKGQVVYRCCNTKLCCNPAHMKCGTKKEAGAFLSESGKFKNQPTRIKANIKSCMKQMIPLERVRAVEHAIASGMLRKDIAAALNINEATITKISSGRHMYSSGRQPVIKQASIFSMGMAA